MKRALALAWLVVVLAAALYGGGQLLTGPLPFQTNLLDLLPREDRDTQTSIAGDLMMQRLARQIVVLVGHSDRDKAFTAAEAIEGALKQAGVMNPSGAASPDAIRQLVTAYLPYSSGLLSDADRRRLETGRATEIVQRALAQITAPGIPVDARQLEADPFLLLPAFFSDLPVPASKITPDRGRLVVVDGGRHWFLVLGDLTGEAFSLDFQDRLSAAYQNGLQAARVAAPDIAVLRLGVPFHALAGSQTAQGEIAWIGAVSLIAVTLVIFAVFRTLMPMVLCLMAMTVGMLVALVVCLLAFGQVHILAVLFGTSLIGSAVDYALHYCTQIFSARREPEDRLHHVLPGIAMGLATSVVGYVALAFTPLTGLHQIAVFSAVGLSAAFVTVAAWFPFLDRMAGRRMTTADTWIAGLVCIPWNRPRMRLLRFSAAIVLVLLAIAGATKFSTVDDVRRQQNLSPDLLSEQLQVQRLTGMGSSTQFFLVHAPDTETALRIEEALDERLQRAAAAGDLSGWQSLARFIPSVARQQKNMELIQSQLYAPHLSAYRDALGLPASASTPPTEPLTPDILSRHTLPFASALILDGEAPGITHAVVLDRVIRPDAVRALAEGIEGVRFYDPADSITDVFARYRERALMLIAISALLMAPLLLWRYGLLGGVRVLVPPVAAVVLTPFLLALTGEEFSFFSAIALVLVLSMGVDFAVFFAEGSPAPEAATMLATLVAMVTSALSFGLLAFSQAHAVHAFGAAMFVGLMLAYLLSPMAIRSSPTR